MERLITQSERASQSTASEILAGALRVAHKRGIEATNADPQWAAAVSWISSTLLSGTLAAPPECIVDWMVCLLHHCFISCFNALITRHVLGLGFTILSLHD